MIDWVLKEDSMANSTARLAMILSRDTLIVLPGPGMQPPRK